jgi:hypothetical protein
MSTEEFLLSLTVFPVFYQPGGATVPQIRSLQSKMYIKMVQLNDNSTRIEEILFVDRRKSLFFL